MCPQGHVFLPPQEKLAGWLPGPEWDTYAAASTGSRVSPSAVQPQKLDLGRGSELIRLRDADSYSLTRDWYITRMPVNLPWETFDLICPFSPFIPVVRGERLSEGCSVSRGLWEGDFSKSFRCLTSGSAHQLCYLLNRNLLSRWSRCFWQGTQFQNPICMSQSVPNAPFCPHSLGWPTLFWHTHCFFMCQSFQASCSLTVVPKASVLASVGLIATKVPGGFTKKWESFLGFRSLNVYREHKWLWSLARLGNHWYKSFIWLRIVLLL